MVLPTTALRLFLLILSGLMADGDRSTESRDIQTLEVFPSEVQLSSKRSQRQLVVTARAADGTTWDVTSVVGMTLRDPELALITGTRLVPQANGRTLLTVTLGNARVEVPVSVTGQETEEQVSFRREVLVALTKQGCNAGSCHGAPDGKGGFALSMLAYAPEIDEESIIYGGLSRRITPLEPEDSLLLKKPLLQIPHVGGKRLQKTDAAWEILHDWIQQGAVADTVSAPACEGISVYPPGTRVLRLPGGRQQLSVMANFSDGSHRDVTAIATYATTNAEVLKVDDSGFVTGIQRGMAAITIRYLDDVHSVFFTVEQDREGFVWNGAPEAGDIDRLVNARLQQMQILPAERTDDAAFLRRAYLDLTGLLPSVDQVRAFHADPSDQKRSQLIDRLLASEEYSRYWASKSADLMRANQAAMPNGRAELFVDWLADSIHRNQPFDQFAEELLTAAGDASSTPAAGYFLAIPEREALAETTAQLFMGSRINCARCHNHPFESWTQNDYYSIAAVFARIRSEGSILSVQTSGEVTHPTTNAVMKPWGWKQMPDESADTTDRRERFSEWLTSPDNSWFARVEVNRIWAHLLGRGIVHPVDDFRSSNPPVNPELLDWLADEFRRVGYDRKHMVRLICNSETWQRSAAASEFNADDTSLFSHAAVRRLTAEQLQDAIGQVTRTVRPIQNLSAEIDRTQQELATASQSLQTAFPMWLEGMQKKLSDRECWQTMWMYSGVYAESDYDRAISMVYEPEAEQEANRLFAGGVRWIRKTDWLDGQQHAFPPSSPGAHYIARRIHASRPGKVVLEFGSDDGARAWLNGVQVLDKPQRRGIKTDEDRLELDLPAGASTLMFKVIDAGGYTGFACRLVSFDGVPIRELDIPLEIAELLQTAPDQFTPEQMELLQAVHRTSDAGLVGLTQRIRDQKRRLEYQTQRSVPEQNEFLMAFGQPRRESPCACERLSDSTIDQTLQILNGELVWNRTREAANHYAAFDNTAVAEEIYLSALSRFPTASEQQQIRTLLETTPNRQEALQDVIWAVINLQEFVFQH